MKNAKVALLSWRIMVQGGYGALFAVREQILLSIRCVEVQV
jgi:hypothetical protein